MVKDGNGFQNPNPFRVCISFFFFLNDTTAEDEEIKKRKKRKHTNLNQNDFIFSIIVSLSNFV